MAKIGVLVRCSGRPPTGGPLHTGHLEHVRLWVRRGVEVHAQRG